MTQQLQNGKQSETWLTLGEAAEQLNVHPSTLRRWANNGDIPALVTPGGHRRFAATDIARFAKDRSVPRNANGVAGLWATQALAHARQNVVSHRDDQWMAQIDNDARSRTRALGQQLMGLTLQYLSSDENETEILTEARRIGKSYATMAIDQGLGLSATLEASIFFRDSLIETALQLPETANIRPEANVRLMRRVNRLLNAVHLAVAEVYEDGSRNDSW